MGFTLMTVPQPDNCSCGGEALNDWDGNMSWPDRVYVTCSACKKQGPKVANPGNRKHPIQAETRAVELWNKQQKQEPDGQDEAISRVSEIAGAE